MKHSGKETKLRLQVFISRSGLCSRRKAMELIQEGHVQVNGRVIREPSFQVNPSGNCVSVDKRSITSMPFDYILLNKPKGYVTTCKDSHAEKTIYDLLPGDFHHLKPVGRLDKDTEGLLLLTNDGTCAFRLTHPKFNVDKEYIVETNKLLKPSDKKVLEKGIFLDGKVTSPAKITRVEGKTFMLTIHEGRKRQVRLMLKSLGYHVVCLKRISQGPLALGYLKVGKWRRLHRDEIVKLKKER